MSVNNYTKSRIIAQTCGWQYADDGITGEWWLDGDKLYDEWVPEELGFEVESLDLWEPKNAHLVALALRWCRENNITDDNMATALAYELVYGDIDVLMDILWGFMYEIR